MYIVYIASAIIISGGCLLVSGYLIWRAVLGKPSEGYIPILAYHKIDHRFELGGTWNTPGQFQRQMEYIKSKGIIPVTLSQALELMKNGRTKNEKYVCLTFDDAYEGLYHHAWPILKKFGYPATIFVVTDFVGRNNEWDVNWGGRKFKHLGWEQIAEMSEAGIEFGSHTRSHRDLRFLNEEQMMDELAGSREILEEKLGKKIQTISYPFGRYNKKVVESASSCGYLCACSLVPKMKNNQIDYMALRRCALYITDNIWGFENKIYQESKWFWLQDLWCRIVNFCAGGTIVVQNIQKNIFRRKRVL